MSPTQEELLKSSEAIFDACALVRNAKPENLRAVAYEFAAWVNDFTHQVKMYLDRGPTLQVESVLIEATRKLAFCEHPQDKVLPGSNPVCASCGAIKMKDSGWAIPLRLVMVQSYLRLLDKEVSREHAKAQG